MPECGGPESPRGSGQFGCCTEENTDLLGLPVEIALNIIEETRPDLFQGPEGRVSDVDGLAEAVCEEIEKQGFCCVQGGPEDEIGIKESNDFSEQFDIVFGTGFLRHNGYAATCRPARF